MAAHCPQFPPRRCCQCWDDHQLRRTPLRMPVPRDFKSLKSLPYSRSQSGKAGLWAVSGTYCSWCVVHKVNMQRNKSSGLPYHSPQRPDDDRRSSNYSLLFPPIEEEVALVRVLIPSVQSFSPPTYANWARSFRKMTFHTLFIQMDAVSLRTRRMSR